MSSQDATPTVELESTNEEGFGRWTVRATPAEKGKQEKRLSVSPMAGRRPPGMTRIRLRRGTMSDGRGQQIGTQSSATDYCKMLKFDRQLGH